MITIYHNPRCRKSREALALLEAREENFEIKKYLEAGLSKKELKDLEKKLNLPLAQFVRKKESLYKELGKPEGEALYAAVTENPILLERPIVVNGNAAAMGRPPENITHIL